MTKVPDCTANRMHRTIEIEMDVPAARNTFLVEKMEYCFAAAPFLKAATRIFMIGKQPREVPMARKSGFD